ncbi:MAG TPA: hypothetical protein PLY40_06900 [Bacillota bacterium]|nr:hypothetical protein [Bacillota bacterium]
MLSLLARYRVQPCLAVPYGRLGAGYARYLYRYGEAGLEPALWPTLPDSLGYWPHEGNAPEFSDYVREIFQWARNEKVEVPWLAVDLETPYYQWQDINRAHGAKKVSLTLRHYWNNRNRLRFAEAAKTYSALQQFLREQGCRTLVPVLPLLELDLLKGGVKLQDYLETPVTPVPWDVISVMQYNSMFIGYSRGLIKPADARWHLYMLCLNARRVLGERASISLGTTSTGKLGNEPYYASPAEMLPDVEAALAAGITDIAVFCLEGILKAPQPEAWFEMICSASPVVPRRSRKMDLARAAARLGYFLLP